MQGVAQAISASQCCGPSSPISLMPAMPLAQGGCRDLHLEMKDASVAILKTLAVGNHSVQNSLVESEGGNGGQEPTVPWDRKDPYQTCSSDLARGGSFCVCGMPGTTWDSLGGVPFISPLTEKTQESGQTSTYADSQSLPGPAGGRSWGSAQWNGNGNYNGENTQNPTPGGLPSAPWQMSVRVAPSTMNWGFDSSSYKTHSRVSGPVPPRNWHPDSMWAPVPLPTHHQNQVPPRVALLP